MIRLPDFVTRKMAKKAKTEVRKEKRLEKADNVVLEEYNEGLSAQILHIGPYSEEEKTIKKLHRFINERGYRVRGYHHEIYLSDPRRTPPGGGGRSSDNP